MKTRGLSWRGATWAVALLLATPVATLLLFAFVPESDSWEHLKSTVLKDYILNSLVLGAGVAVGTFVIGTGTAWLTTMYHFPGRRLFQWALLLPMAMPAYIIAFTYTGLLDATGPLQEGLRQLTGLDYGDYWFPDVRSLGGATAMLTLVLYPYVYLLSRASFVEQSLCVLDVGRTLGLGPFQRFWRIALPLARPGIVAGVSLAVMETLADYGTVQYFGLSTFTTGIFRTWFGLNDPAGAARLSVMLLAIVMLFLFIERRSRQRNRYNHTSQRLQRLQPTPLTGYRAALATAACAAPLVLGFALPMVQLGQWAIAERQRIDPAFLQLGWNSLWLAALTAVLAVALAALLAYTLRLHQTLGQRIAVRSAGLGYAIPGTVVAVGVMIPAGEIDRLVNQLWPQGWGDSPGLILSGTFTALVFAYLVRFMAVSLQTIDSGLGKIKPSLDDAAQSLGASRWRLLSRIHIPMMRGSLLTALLLVFVDVLKELPATLVMRPFNFNTLAVRAFELASDERLAQAALPAVAIVLTGLIPVILLSVSIARGRRPGPAATGSNDASSTPPATRAQPL
ncbi:MAG: ABC transporter permease [Pseudomonadota bacterium]